MQIKILCNFILRCDRWYFFPFFTWCNSVLLRWAPSFLLYAPINISDDCCHCRHCRHCCSHSKLFAIVQCNSLPLFCHRDVFRTWHTLFFSLAVEHYTAIPQLNLCNNRCLPSPVLVSWFWCPLFSHAHYNSPSKLNRFSVFRFLFTRRCHRALQQHIDSSLVLHCRAKVTL